MELTTMSITSTPALTPNNNMTSEEIEQYLDHLQDEEFVQYIPVLVYLLLLAVTGLVGNVLVLVVYKFQYPKSPTRIFIMSIALFDLITNVVCIPGLVYETFYKWTFDWPSFCRFIKYANANTTIVSACILVAVAVSRYKKVCKPFGKQVTTLQAKIAVSSIIFFALIAAIPYAILNGSYSRPTPISGIVGHECFIDDGYIKTIWPTVNYGFILLLFIVLCTPMVVLYTLIGIKAYKHRKMHGVGLGSVQVKEKSNSSQKSTKTNMTDLPEDKPWKRFFNILSRKNNSRNQNSEGEEEKGSKSMAEENQKIEKTEDNCAASKELPQKYDTKVEDQSNIDIEFLSTPKKTSLSKRVPPQSSLLQNIQALLDTLTRWRTPKDDEQNEKDKNECKTFDNISIEGEKVQTHCPNFVTDKPPVSALKAKDTPSKIPKQDAKIDNECRRTPTFEGKDMSNGAIVDREKRQSVVGAQSLKNVEKSFVSRTTGVLFLITAIFVVGFIPHIAIVFFRYTQPANFKAMGTASSAAYHLFYRSYLLNCAANPIIYSLRDVRFRQKVLNLFPCH